MTQEELLRAVAAGQVTYWAAKDKVVLRPVAGDREVRAPGEVISFVDNGLVDRALEADLVTCQAAALGTPRVRLELTGAGREALALVDQARELARA
jgi:hypothetical protein